MHSKINNLLVRLYRIFKIYWVNVSLVICIQNEKIKYVWLEGGKTFVGDLNT